MFKTTDYIVPLKDEDSSNNWNNYCLMARCDGNHLAVHMDLTGGQGTWWSRSFKDKDCWRYATKAEIAEYNRLGKPFDVTKFNTENNTLFPIF
jgi:hypothetical protein